MIRFKYLLNTIKYKIRIIYYKVLYGLPVININNLIGASDYKVKNVIKDYICMPPYHGPKEFDDINLLLKTINYYNPKIVLEFGTAHGNTVANICRQINLCTVYTVNALENQMTGHVVTYSDLSLKDIGIVYKQYGFSHRVIQIYKNTLEINLTEYFDNPIIDIAIIDACHDLHYVINDFLKIEPFIRKKGLIFLHDTHPSMKNTLFGSYFACMILRKRGFDIKHLQNSSWGIYIK